MREMFSISSGLDVAKAKPITSSSKDTSDSKDTDTSSSKDFLSIMFAQIKQSIKASSESEKLEMSLESTKTENIKIDLSEEGTQKSLDEHLLDDLLKVITLLKDSDKKTPSFPSFSNKIEKLINSDLALKELKEVNNISDLLKLSKKYDLGLEKITVTKLDAQTLKKEFPILDKKQFFEMPKDVNTKESSTKSVETPKTLTKENEIKPTTISIIDMEKPLKEVKKEPTLLEKMMSDSKKSDKKEVEILQVNKETIKEKLVEDKKEVAVKVNEEVKKSIKITQEDAPKIIVKEEQKEIKTKVLKEDLHVKVDKDVKVAKEELHVKVEKDIKEPIASTRINETKVESNTASKSMIENILQGIKTAKPMAEPKIAASTLIQENSKLDSTSTETTENKTEPASNRSELKMPTKLEVTSNKQISSARETFNNFANDLREKMENYKPPIMKVQLALNPKGLGEVDITVISRGNNLHVSLSSNTNTMSLFTQNQAEFKNSLVNMGFTNLEMNFSDQREKNQQQHKNATSSNENYNENYDEQNEEETTSIELVVPQYV